MEYYSAVKKNSFESVLYTEILWNYYENTMKILWNTYTEILCNFSDSVEKHGIQSSFPSFIGGIIVKIVRYLNDISWWFDICVYVKKIPPT